MAPRPKCIIVTGQAGSGKTTLAKRLGQQLWMPVISRDELKEGYVNTHGVAQEWLPADTDAVVTNFFFQIVSEYLAARVSVIIEAAFQHHVWEPRLAPILELADAVIILCTIDPIRAAERHLQRGLEHPNRGLYHTDNRVTHYKKTGEFLNPAPYEPPNLDISTIRVSTERKYVPTIEEIAARLYPFAIGRTE